MFLCQQPIKVKMILFNINIFLDNSRSLAILFSKICTHRPKSFIRTPKIVTILHLSLTLCNLQLFVVRENISRIYRNVIKKVKHYIWPYYITSFSSLALLQETVYIIRLLYFLVLLQETVCIIRLFYIRFDTIM